MMRLFVRHNVDDFTKWKQAYDAFNGEAQGMGVKAHGVYTAFNDHNNVTLWHDFDDLEAAEKFIDSERLGEVMLKAGVIEQPDMWLTTSA